MPDTRITWAGRRGAHGVLAGLDDLRDGVVPLAGRMAEGARAPFRAGKLLRGLDCDVALLLPNSWSSALEAQRARIPTRIGTNLNRRGPLLTQTLQGMKGERIFHWRADRPGLASFNPTFDGLMGGSQLSAADMATFVAFMSDIPFMPNPNRNRQGFDWHDSNRLFQGASTSCSKAS